MMTQIVARSSAVVVPRPLKWYDRLAASTAYSLIELVAFTLRMRWDTETPRDRVMSSQQGIFCVWHNRLAVCLIVYRDFICRGQRTPKLAAIVSASKDGGIVARVLEHFKVQPVRGSSSRRGPQAMLELTGWAERGYDLAFTYSSVPGKFICLKTTVVLVAAAPLLQRSTLARPAL